MVVSLYSIICMFPSAAFDDYVPIRPVLSFVAGGPTTVCQTFSIVPDPSDSPIVEDIENFMVAFEQSAEIDILEPSTTTVYIIDENGKQI